MPCYKSPDKWATGRSLKRTKWTLTISFHCSIQASDDNKILLQGTRLVFSMNSPVLTGIILSQYSGVTYLQVRRNPMQYQ